MLLRPGYFFDIPPHMGGERYYKTWQSPAGDRLYVEGGRYAGTRISVQHMPDGKVYVAAGAHPRAMVEVEGEQLLTLQAWLRRAFDRALPDELLRPQEVGFGPPQTEDRTPDKVGRWYTHTETRSPTNVGLRPVLCQHRLVSDESAVSVPHE